MVNFICPNRVPLPILSPTTTICNGSVAGIHAPGKFDILHFRGRKRIAVGSVVNSQLTPVRKATTLDGCHHSSVNHHRIGNTVVTTPLRVSRLDCRYGRILQRPAMNQVSFIDAVGYKTRIGNPRNRSTRKFFVADQLYTAFIHGFLNRTSIGCDSCNQGQRRRHFRFSINLTQIQGFRNGSRRRKSCNAPHVSVYFALAVVDKSDFSTIGPARDV